MRKIIVNGGNRICGEISISGSKNASLPIMAASILSSGILELNNIPHVSDISIMTNILADLGIKVNLKENILSEDFSLSMQLDGKNINKFTGEYEMVRQMRASFLIIGPLLARFGKARVSLPGGCAIGVRPINIHLDAFVKMGAKVEIIDGYVEVYVKGKLKGEVIDFKFPSVGATQNVMMAATLAQGKTVINGAAREVEIIDLAQCLRSMGAKIKGDGSNKIEIIGVKSLNSTVHQVISDKIEAGTYILATAITNGNLRIKNINKNLLQGFYDKMIKAGISIKELDGNTIEVKRAGDKIKPIDIATGPAPKFPTDMQAQFMALTLFADGQSSIQENVFENRFMHIMELLRMGADIKCDKNIAIINGGKHLKPAIVMATDLRASVSLVLTALAIKGKTTINRIYHLDRGYERLAEKLNKCGADVEISYADYQK